MPNCAAAPRSNVFGLASSGPKSVERADPHEHQQRENGRIHAHQVDQVQYAVAGRDLHARDVGQDAAEADRHEQERFELALDGEVQQEQADADHDALAERNLIQARRLNDFHELRPRALFMPTDASPRDLRTRRDAAAQSRSNSASPTPTASPSATCRAVTVPARGATTSVSIFIASSTSTASPPLNVRAERHDDS